MIINWLASYDWYPTGEHLLPIPVFWSVFLSSHFTATTVGSLSVDAEEEMSIVEHDNGDGWTRIRRNNGEEGFVPTSYIRILWEIALSYPFALFLVAHWSAHLLSKTINASFPKLWWRLNGIDCCSWEWNKKWEFILYRPALVPLCLQNSWVTETMLLCLWLVSGVTFL